MRIQTLLQHGKYNIYNIFISVYLCVFQALDTIGSCTTHSVLCKNSIHTKTLKIFSAGTSLCTMMHSTPGALHDNQEQLLC